MNLQELAGYELVSVFYKTDPWAKIYIYKIGQDRYEIEDTSSKEKTVVKMPFNKLKEILKDKNFKETIYENIDNEDTVTTNIPLLLRILEYAREDAKTDMDLHHVVERLVKRNAEKQVLSMEDYDFIVGNDKEEVKVSKFSSKKSPQEVNALQPGVKIGSQVVIKDPQSTEEIKFGRLIKFSENGYGHVQMSDGERYIVPPSWIFPNISSVLSYEKGKAV